MKKIQLLAFATLLSCGMFLNTGCNKKDSTSTPEENIAAAEDNAAAEGEFSSASDTGDSESQASPGTKKTAGTRRYSMFADSAVVTVDSTSIAGRKIVTIDYGALAVHGYAPAKGVLCKDGRYRSGKVIYNHALGLFTPMGAGKTAIMTFDNYFAGDGTIMNQHTGIKTLTNTTTLATAATPSFTEVVTGASIITASGTIAWAANRTITKTAGASTPLTPFDDEYTVTGSSSGTNRQGDVFTSVIDAANPLLKKIQAGCANTFVSGKVTITNSSTSKVMLLDYGTGTCDRLATVTVGGTTRTIIIK